MTTNAYQTLPESVLSAWEQKKAVLEAERAKWLTVDEAAYVLGTSRDTVFRMIESKTIKVQKEGRVIRIHVEDLRPE